MIKLFVLLGVLLTFSFVGFTQDCGCDYLVESTDDIFDGTSVSPGEVICLESGERGRLRLVNVKGSILSPVQIKNCGGAVIIDATSSSFGIRVQACDYIHFTGAGMDGVDMGIQIDNSSGFR